MEDFDNMALPDDFGSLMGTGPLGSTGARNTPAGRPPPAPGAGRSTAATPTARAVTPTSVRPQSLDASAADDEFAGIGPFGRRASPQPSPLKTGPSSGGPAVPSAGRRAGRAPAQTTPSFLDDSGNLEPSSGSRGRSPGSGSRAPSAGPVQQQPVVTATGTGLWSSGLVAPAARAVDNTEDPTAFDATNMDTDGRTFAVADDYGDDDFEVDEELDELNGSEGGSDDSLMAAMGMSSRPESRRERSRSSAGDRQGRRASQMSVGSESRQSPVSSRKRELQRLQEEERALLAELESISKEVGAKEKAVTAAETAQEAAVAERKQAVQAKETQLEKLREDVSTKRSETDEYITAKKSEISAAQEEDIARLEETHRPKEEARKEALMADVRADIAKRESEIAKVSEERELLKANGSFTEQGIYVAVEDESSLEAKLSLGIQLVASYIDQTRVFFTDHVTGMIRMETRKVVDEIWSSKAKLAEKEAGERREALDAHRKQYLDDFFEFQKGQAEQRAKFRETFHQQLNEASAQLRSMASERQVQLQNESQRQFDSAASEFGRRFDATVANAEAKARRILVEDEKIAVAQSNEVASRLHTALELTKKLYGSEEDELGQRLERERQLMGHTQHSLSSEAASAIAAMKSEVASLVETIGSLQDNIKQHTMDQQGYTEVVRHSDGKADINSVRGALASKAAREAEVAGRLIREREDVVNDLKATVLTSVDELNVQSTQCEIHRDQLHARLEELAAQMRDQHLAIQGEQSKGEVVRLQWEKEHRMMLSGGIRTTAPSSEQSSSENGGALDIRHHPYLAGLWEVAQLVRTKANLLLEWSDGFREKRKVMLLRQRAEDDTVTDHNEKVAARTTQLFQHMLGINKQQTTVHEQHVKTIAESAKAEIEREVFEHDKADFVKKTAALQQDAKELQRISDDAAAQRSAKKKEMDDAVDSAMRLEAEKDQLIKLQQSMHQKQANLYEEGRRLDHSLFRMHQKRLVSEVAAGDGGMMALSQMSLNAGNSPNSMNRRAGGSSRFAFDPSTMLGPDLVTISTSSLSSDPTPAGYAADYSRN